MKISHKELEACRFSPKAWVVSKQEQSQAGGPRFGYNQALNYSICELHKTNDLDAAIDRLEGYFKKFKNEKKMDAIREKLIEYDAWLQTSGTVPIDTNVTINYPYDGQWHLGGMISRVDLISNGYRAVVFEKINQN